LEGFASKFGADFYGLAHNTSTITLKKQDRVVPASYPFISGDIVPFMAEKTLSYIALLIKVYLASAIVQSLVAKKPCYKCFSFNLINEFIGLR
jgi:hypothetical protein